MNKICVIINCYGHLHRLRYIRETIFKLKQNDDDNIDLKFIFVDSSPTDIYRNNNLYLKKILKDGLFDHLHLDNKGAPYSLNKAIDFSLKAYNPDLVMILTDDAILESSIIYSKVLEYFMKNCRPEYDILVLTNDLLMIQKNEIRRSTENGMIFSPKLWYKIKFREDLVMDQFDLLFCDEIHRLGGKILVFPSVLLGVEPIGREKINGINLLPPWRIYLLVRNTISLYIEGKESFFKDVLLQDFYWFSKGILFYHEKLKYIQAIFLGLLDGLNHRLGITKNLQRLSKNRFNEEE
jgi:hypothetical protein